VISSDFTRDDPSLDPTVLQKPINSLLHHAMHFRRKFLISRGDDDGALNLDVCEAIGA
jgi:hypothetical protein